MQAAQGDGGTFERALNANRHTAGSSTSKGRKTKSKGYGTKVIDFATTFVPGAVSTGQAWPGLARHSRASNASHSCVAGPCCIAPAAAVIDCFLHTPVVIAAGGQRVTRTHSFPRTLKLCWSVFSDEPLALGTLSCHYTIAEPLLPTYKRILVRVAWGSNIQAHY